MRKFVKEINSALSNECGGPNVEQVMGIAVALAVGVGLFLFGKAVFNWFNGCAGDTVTNIKTPEAEKFDSTKW